MAVEIIAWGLLPILEAMMVSVSAWLAWRSLVPALADTIEELVGWGVMFVALVAGAGVLLGAMGALGRNGFAAAQFATLVVLLGLRRRQLVMDGRAANNLLHAILSAVRQDRMVLCLAVGLGVFVTVTGVLAAFAEPVVYDALTYRLSRIGHWLQEGRVTHFITNDPRQNYMPVVPDLVMAWIVSAFPGGFHGAALVQWGGGVLLLTATIGLARLAGLGRAGALGAAWLAAGTANVAPQFTTVHTDLFTAGLLTAAFYLWQKAATRGVGSWAAGIGGGLALGAKGTVLYLGPTLLLWAVWTGWQLRVPVRAWGRTLLATLGAAAIFALPGFVGNWRIYGGPLGPAEFVSMHHQGARGHLVDKTTLNLATSFVQMLEPNSQPPGLQGPARAVGARLAAALPLQDSFSYENLNRRGTLQTIIDRSEPDADVTSFGLLASGLFLLGAAWALRSNRPGAAGIRQWSVGVVVFFIFFHAMQQWHPYGFRYFVLVAPWMAVIAAWGLAALRGPLRKVAWALALLATAATAGNVLTRTHQAGWRAVTQPEHSRNYYVYRGWREWAGGLGRPVESLEVALPFNRPLAAFYRLQPVRAVHPRSEATLTGLSAEQAVAQSGNGWLIVPALRFLGNEGRVAARTWLFDGDPGSPFSVAAYHRLSASAPGEPIVYRHRILPGKDDLRHELLVRTGDTGRVTLHLESAAGAGWRYVVTSPTEVVRGAWPGGPHELSLALPANKVAEVVVVFEPTGSLRSLPLLEIGP